MSWDEDRHPRLPKGTPGGGRFGKGAEGVAARMADVNVSRSHGEFAPQEIAGDEFHVHIARARAGGKGAFLSLYSPAEYSRMRCFSAEGGKVGGALKDHGDGRVEIVSLFNNGGSRGAGMKMMDHLISQGGNYCECYGDQLRGLYEGKGFHVTEAYEFDDSMAAPDWNYARDGRPPYYLLRRSS